VLTRKNSKDENIRYIKIIEVNEMYDFIDDSYLVVQRIARQLPCLGNFY